MPSPRLNISATLPPRPATLVHLSLYTFFVILPVLSTPMTAVEPKISPAPSNSDSSNKTTQIVVDVIFSLVIILFLIIVYSPNWIYEVRATLAAALQRLCDTYRSFRNTLSPFQIDTLLQRAANTWAVDGTNNPSPTPHTPAAGDTPIAVQAISHQPGSPSQSLQPGEATATPGSASSSGCTSPTSDNGAGPSSTA